MRKIIDYTPMLENPGAHTAREWAEIIGASPSAVSRSACRHGVILKKGHPNNKVDIDLIAANPGIPIRKWAERFGVTYNAVQKALKRNGVDHRTGKRDPLMNHKAHTRRSRLYREWEVTAFQKKWLRAAIIK